MAKTVEIDETALLAQQGVVNLVNDILRHPEGRKLMHQATKAVRPDATIPEYDAKQEVLGEVAKLQESNTALLKRLDDEKAEREAAQRNADFRASWDRQKTGLRNKGWLDDGVDKVEAFAIEKGITDLTIAAAAYENLHPPADPVVPSGFGSFDLFNPPADDGDEMKKLIDSRGDDPQALASLVNKALGDVRGGR